MFLKWRLSHKADATQLEEFFGMVKGETDKADLGDLGSVIEPTPIIANPDLSGCNDLNS